MLELGHGKCTIEFLFVFVKFNVMRAFFILSIFQYMTFFKTRQVPLSLHAHIGMLHESALVMVLPRIINCSGQNRF